jgi:DNA-binding NtrC family response regulator
VEIVIPALRERGGDDITDLAEHFVQQFSRRYRKGPLRLSDSARAALVTYAWPGNVRELENTIERAVVLASGPTIGGKDLALEARRTTQIGIPTLGASQSSVGIPIAGQSSVGISVAGQSSVAIPVADVGAIVLPPDLSLEEAERRYARAVLEREDGNQSAAARALGISRNKLARLLRGRD